MSEVNGKSERSLEIAGKQGTLWYQIKKSKVSIYKKNDI